MRKIVRRAIKKGQSSVCRQKVAAIGFDRGGNFIAVKRNDPRFDKEGGSLHAEEALMNRYGKVLGTIVVLRTNTSGELKPISPCSRCSAQAEKLGVKILTVEDL